MRRGYALASLGLAVVVAVVVAIAVGDDDDDDGDAAQPEVAVSVSDAAGISEDNLPPGFEKTPTVELEGKEWTFDEIPGHYWKVLDDGYAVGLHFQTDEPFPWAEDVPAGELLYMIYAIPGSCGNGSYEEAVESADASVVGPLPAGFDHWHAVVAGPSGGPNGSSETGHWLMHMPVRDFTFAGEEGNPLRGEPVTAGNPGFIPVCDIR